MPLGLLSLKGGAANTALPFQGNPNATITDINTSGGIVSSRTSGRLPAFMHFSASAITATGTSYPFRDLCYVWTITDTSPEVVFNPVTNQNTNANIQRGPECSYVFRTAGSWNVKLDIRGKNGSGYTTATWSDPSNGRF